MQRGVTASRDTNTDSFTSRHQRPDWGEVWGRGVFDVRLLSSSVLGGSHRGKAALIGLCIETMVCVQNVLLSAKSVSVGSSDFPVISTNLFFSLVFLVLSHCFALFVIYFVLFCCVIFFCFVTSCFAVASNFRWRSKSGEIDTGLMVY